MIPYEKVHKFRVLASRYSLTLIYVWSGVMLAGLGLFYYKHKTGAKVHFTSEDMQPNEEVSRKMMNWIEKLGLDQTMDKPRRR